MEHIRQAVERAKARHLPHREPPDLSISPQPLSPGSQPLPLRSGKGRVDHVEVARPLSGGRIDHAEVQYKEFTLQEAHLKANRIVSYDISDPCSKPFDMLRTQVLQAMDAKSWRVVGVISPTPGCGKTLTAVNLALSIARRAERSAILVDMDLQKPRVASSLGLKCDDGLLGVLQGRSTLSSAIIQARIGPHSLMVLPTRASKSGSAELMASHAVSAMLQQIERDFPSRTIVLDLPPLLAGDDVIAILPQIDCVLLMAAIGTTTVRQIEECSKHLQSAEILRVVLNKVPEQEMTTYCYY